MLWLEYNWYPAIIRSLSSKIVTNFYLSLEILILIIWICTASKELARPLEFMGMGETYIFIHL